MKQFVQPSTAANALLQLMPVRECDALVRLCQTVPLAIEKTLVGPGETLKHVYFPVSGYISLLTPDDVAAPLEVGIVGSEGMFGATLLLGVKNSPVTALVQGQGKALRIGAAKFESFLAQNEEAKAVLNRYLYVTLAQIAQSAACNRSHRVDARLARWILTTQDRAHSNVFLMTHLFLAHMLGVRRAGVTVAAQSLQSKGLIKYSRGRVSVLDRPALQARACGCYDALRQTYRTTMLAGPKPKRTARPKGV